MIECWANYSGGHSFLRTEKPNIHYKSISDPDALYKELKAICIVKEKRINLTIVHNACKKQYKNGNLDFSSSKIWDICQENENFKLSKHSFSIKNNDYLKLIMCWAKKAGGIVTKADFSKAPYNFMTVDEILDNIKHVKNIDGNPTPEIVLEKLKDQVHKKVKVNLDTIHEICKNQFESRHKDFSIYTIEKLSNKGKKKNQISIKSNPKTNLYRALIKSWSHLARGFTGENWNSELQSDIDTTLNPNEILIKLQNQTTAIKRKKLKQFNKLLSQYSEDGNKDFSLRTIATIAEQKSLITYNYLRKDFLNKNPTYYILIEAWKNKSNGFCVPLNKKDDVEFMYLCQVDPLLDDWRILASLWFKEQLRSRTPKANALDKFLIGFITKYSLERNPIKFLNRNYSIPSFKNSIDKNLSQPVKTSTINYIHQFLNWILSNKLTVENSDGSLYLSNEFHNPIKSCSSKSRTSNETYRTPLPYCYIRELRSLLVEGANFKAWTWAQQVTSDFKPGKGDWFVVNPDIIDKNDEDCVWRERRINTYNSRGSIEGKKTIYEIWSPVAAVALLIKLELPLRNFQVRMLDSGEADTWRYQNGSWIINASPFAQGDKKHPYQRGVLYRSADLNNQKIMTTLLINTNKTADINVPEENKGYIILWQHEKVIKFLAKLRDWQEKYNPIKEPIKWIDLLIEYFGGRNIHEKGLEERGTACFLFRDPTKKIKGNSEKPIFIGPIQRLWYELLKRFEEKLYSRGETFDDNSKIEFVDSNSRSKTYFDLHSLRVALIIAFAIDGGVPIEILSKLVAGHSRLVMTLYYTKAGYSYVTEVLEEAESKIIIKEKDSLIRFLKDESIKNIESRFATNDPAAAIAASQQISSAAFQFTDLGVCPIGLGGCDIGGELIKDHKTNPNRREYAKVPGYPEKNCVRCRFFLTSPAFIPGLVSHFNFLSWQLSENSTPYIRCENLVAKLEDQLAFCEQQDLPFSKSDELGKARSRLEETAEKVNKLWLDLQSTFALIERSIEIDRNNDQKDELSLIAKGTPTDLSYALSEIDSEMHQIEIICQDAVIYPNRETSKATIRRSQILDTMFELNERKPFLFKLDEEQQLTVGNHIMKLIRKRVGNIADAVNIAEGKCLLKDIGILDETDSLIENETIIEPDRLSITSIS